MNFPRIFFWRKKPTKFEMRPYEQYSRQINFSKNTQPTTNRVIVKNVSRSHIQEVPTAEQYIIVKDQHLCTIDKWSSNRITSVHGNDSSRSKEENTFLVFISQLSKF